MYAFGTIKFESRSDIAAAHNELFDALLPTFSEGGARVRINATGSSCTPAAAEFEGFLRPLWGIVPYSKGGFNFKHWDLYRKGLVNGCNSQHEEFWGNPGNFDQILVDIAAVAYSISLCKKDIWDPLADADKKIVIDYLLNVREKEFCHNNWKFFKVLVDIALQEVGISIETASTSKYLDDLESLYLGSGWYGDGKTHRIDYYNPFAFHYYGLIYVMLRKKQDPARCQRFLDRAHLFAKDFIHWFADDGAALPYGRSLNYRFAAIGFWGLYAGALDPTKEPPIPWGVLKSIYLDHFKWWAKQPMLNHGSKLLTLGYSYPNHFMTERYNSPQSPYWGMKAFSGLFLPETHPFWAASTEPLRLSSHYVPVIGMHFFHYKSNTIALVNGPWNDEYQTEKYTKFAYSTRYGFGLISNHRTFPLAHLDNMIGFSFNQREFWVREDYKAYISDDGAMISQWHPVEGVDVETTLIPHEKFHVRIHRIKNHTDKEVFTKEGGFSVSSGTRANVESITENGAKITTETDYSIIRDLLGKRKAKITLPEPNTNLLHPKVLIPELIGSVKPNSSITFITAVGANPLENGVYEEFAVPDVSARTNISRVPCNDSK